MPRFIDVARPWIWFGVCGDVADDLAATVNSSVAVGVLTWDGPARGTQRTRPFASER